MKVAQLKRAFLVKPAALILLLFLAQSSLEELMGIKSSCKVEGMRYIIPAPGDREETRWMMMRKKMLLVALDKFDGCECYSDDDCKNTPGCGSHCSYKINAHVIGICRQFGPVDQD